jgi:hypothetical protein
MKGWTTPNRAKYAAETKRRELVREYHELSNLPARSAEQEKRLMAVAKRLGYV